MVTFVRNKFRRSATALSMMYLSFAVLLIAPSVPPTFNNLSVVNILPNSQKLDASSEILAATNSLESGHGPSGLGAICLQNGFMNLGCTTGRAGISLLPSVAHSAPGWTELGPAHPSSFLLGSIDYDAADGYVVLFGGATSLGSINGETWKYSGGTWTHITPSSSPPARLGAGMAYDSADGYVLLFGGFDSAFKPLRDTWKFSSGSWTNITGTNGPAARAVASMAYDALPTDQYIVLFGGTLELPPTPGTITSALKDTWKFSGGSWQNITMVSGPCARAGASISYDAADGYIVLFGGQSPTAFLGDTWKFSGGSWTSISASNNPGKRTFGSMAYDAAPGDGYVVLFGGGNNTISTGFKDFQMDTWKFSAGSWTNITTATSPGGQFGQPIVFDAGQGDGYLLLFSTGLLSWKFSGGIWTLLTPFLPSPSPRVGASMTYDAADGYVVLFGGAIDTSISPGLLGDTWKFQGGVWTNITTTSGPSRGAYIPMAYDASDGYVLLTVGSVSWAFKGGLWTNIPTNCSTAGTCPPPRYGSSAIYDVADGYVVLFGGCCKSSSRDGLRDTWEFHAGVWTNVTTSSGPPPRLFTTMAYDAVDGYGVLFGGVSSNPTVFPFSGTLGDTWKFAEGSWTNITTTTGPPARTLSTLAYDAADGYTLLFGGVSGTTGFFGDTWRFLAGTWTNIPTSIAPSARSNGSIAYDDADHYIVLFGGTSTAVGLSDTWTWESVIGTRTTFTQLRCYPAVIATSQSQNCMVAVTDSVAAGASVPIGTVTLTVTGVTGTFTPSPCPLTPFLTFGGFCSFTFSATTTGAATITAHYDGDSAHATSSTTFQITIANLHPTTITVVCTPTSATRNQPIMCTATVTDTSASGAVPPSGLVQLPVLNPNTSNPVGCTLIGTGATSTCTATGIIGPYAPAPPTTFTQTTWFDGDTAHDGSITTVQLTLIRTTTTTVACLPASVNIGTATICTATVTDNDAGTVITPTGTVDFSTSGTGTFATSPCTLAAGTTTGTASCFVMYTPTGTAAGTDTITTSYVHDAYHADSSNTATVTVTVTALNTSTTVTCNPSSVLVGQSSTCTATVTDHSSSTTTPTGSVAFALSGVTGTLPNCTLAPGTATGTATCNSTFTASTAGTARITASYNGDTTHSTSTSLAATVTVNLRTTGTAVFCSPSTIVIGQSINCTVTVTDSASGTVVTPAGLVNFGPTLSCRLTSGTVAGSATCSVQVTPNAVGLLVSVGADYPGDTVHSGSRGASNSIMVSKRATSITINCLPSTLTVGQPTTCTFTVSDTDTGTAITPTGTVTMSTSLTCTLSGTGSSVACMITVTPPFAGASVNIPGTYGADTSHSGNTGSTSITVNRRPTTTSVSCTPSSVNTGSATTCTATVTDSSGIGAASTPQGYVLFISSGQGTFTTSPCTLAAGTATATASCSVQYTPSSPTAETDTKTATYCDAFNCGSNPFPIHATSTNMGQVSVTLPSLADFTILADPTSLTLSAEGSENCRGGHDISPCDDEGQITITITALNGFTGQVGLSVSSSPHIDTELSKTTIDTAATSTLNINEASPGDYTVTITGTSGSIINHATINITVRSPEKLKCGGGDKDDCNIESDAPLSNTNFSGHTIHFVMTGDAGTTGAANVTIGKSTVPDIHRIKVRVDGNELSDSDLTITSDDNNYHVYFKVTFHSPVVVDIDLNPTPTILGLDPTIFYGIVGALGLIIAGVAAVVYRARKRPSKILG